MHRELDTHSLKASACEYHYHQLLNVLLKMKGQTQVRDKPSWLTLKPSDWLSFPASDVHKLTQGHNDNWQLEATFFGLYGVDAPTPHYFLQDVTQNSEAGKCIAAFLDIFNQNAYWLLHKSWQKFQPLANAGNDNLFIKMCLAISGRLPLPRSEYNKGSDGDAPSTVGQKGFSVGALSNRKKSLCVVENMLRHALSLPNLMVSSNLVKTVDTHQALPLGELLSLGDNTLLGSKVSVVGQAIKINLGVISLEHLEDFKPGGEKARYLASLLEDYLPTLVSYRIGASVVVEGMPPMELSTKGQALKLGAPLVLGEAGQNIEYEFSDQSYQNF
ncbi:type VI secretion system baseplate subunit TssG [Marinomonas mediterranea]|uniref:type VI secretion system baseplate subunit TssG n=1 Tax=Marinomonas mediterranea TaxID=119864 RepID=UPI002349A8E0|nr:type VI secretion system baseplate subunit TssG [Marinomonas mediterranea]WCN10811.1 hypothetical protein GV055_18700 [Marinomonas mediterranea]WCN14868.1 hypothetical protein GV054_18580 [Marinomonas mediterranea]